jgi:hypothetical protein
MSNLSEAGELLFDARQLVDVIRMAASDLGEDGERDTIQAVARLALEKIARARHRPALTRN